MKFPLTDSATLRHRFREQRGDYDCEDHFDFVPVEFCQDMERDLMILALRLFAEDKASFAPETAEVMERLNPLIKQHISNSFD